MLTLDVLKRKQLATTRSGPAMTESQIVGQNTLEQEYAFLNLGNIVVKMWMATNVTEVKTTNMC